MTTVIEGRVTPADKAANPYLYLPFTVPSGTTRIDVRYAYDAGNVLDLGLADPRLGPFPSRAGFRGWSGGARERCFVATDEATPGYLAGDMPPGSWQVILGLYRVKAEGCRYRVEIVCDDRPRGRVLPPPVFSCTRRGAGWYKGDLHSHSHHSDARGSLAELASAARARGLDFLAVTDHNTCSHHRVLPELSDAALLLVPGQEITTEAGHANAWGVVGLVDFRFSGADVAALVREVQSRGGVFSVNHPKEGGPAWRYPFPEAADCLEVWQAPWPTRNAEALARYQSLLAQGRRLTLVGGSDRHQPSGPEMDPEELRVGSPTTWLYLDELSVPAVLTALRTGRAFVSESPAGPRLALEVAGAEMGAAVRAPGGGSLTATARVEGARGDLLRWVGAAGVLRERCVESDSFCDEIAVDASAGFVRLELVSSQERARETLAKLVAHHTLPSALDARALARQELVRALSNPVYIQRA